VPLTRDRATDVLAGVLGLGGSLHFVAGEYLEAVPHWVPAKRAVVYASGALEVVCALGLARRKQWAGPLSAAVLLAIWPANFQMALDAGTGRNAGIWDSPVLMWARVPLQLPMIWVAWRSTGGPRAGGLLDE
jgi:uncharacterized membrane protein